MGKIRLGNMDISMDKNQVKMMAYYIIGLVLGFIAGITYMGGKIW